MVRYLAILNFTDRGMRDVHESITRANEFRAMVETADGEVIQVYWAVGECDGVISLRCRMNALVRHSCCGCATMVLFGHAHSASTTKLSF
jgi:uncharacterized protein with GYD domain